MTGKATSASDADDPRGALRLVPGLDVRAGQLVAARYRVESLVETCGACVFLSATHVVMRQPVTLKLFASYTDVQSEGIAKQLERARVAAELRGEHVAHVVDVGTTEAGLPYVAIERHEGVTLEAELDARGRLPFSEATRWILEACVGLAEAHGRGLVHGALRPRNLLLATPTPRRGRDRTGARQARETRTLKVLDFGTLGPLDLPGEQSLSAFVGSPAYLAPEQLRAPDATTERADIWALGVLLYELIAGTPPFVGESVSQVMMSVAFDAPSLLTDAPYELARLVHRCLSKLPAERPADVAVLARELAPFAGNDGDAIADRVERALASAANGTTGRRASTSSRARDEGSIAPVAVSLERMPELGLRPGWKTVQARARRDAGTTQPSRRAQRRRSGRGWLVGLCVCGSIAAIASWRLRAQADGRAAAHEAPPSVGVAAVGTAAIAPDTSEPRAVRAPASLQPRVPRALLVEGATSATGLASEPSEGGDDSEGQGGRVGPEPSVADAEDPATGRSRASSRHGRRPNIVRTPPWPEPPQAVAPPLVAPSRPREEPARTAPRAGRSTGVAPRVDARTNDRKPSSRPVAPRRAPAKPSPKDVFGDRR